MKRSKIAALLLGVALPAVFIASLMLGETMGRAMRLFGLLLATILLGILARYSAGWNRDKSE